MKRQVLALALAGGLALSMLGCGSSSESTTETEVAEEPLSLIGNWEPEELGDSYQAGFITEDTITIYWISDEGTTASLYWAGTYEAPTEATDSYSWDSENDTDKTDYALLASGDETKTFTYEDGVLSYSVTALGTTTTYELVMTDTDYSVFDSESSDESSEETVEETDGSEAEETTADSSSDVTLGMSNALDQALSYLNYSAFSYTGLIDQLEYEGYSTDEATYAVDNCGADWNEQALLKAQSYLEYSAFSESGLEEQLEYEGFTTDEATYAVENCGADWNEQAVLTAENYLEYSSFSESELINQLEYEGFSTEQAEYAVEQVGY